MNSNCLLNTERDQIKFLCIISSSFFHTRVSWIFLEIKYNFFFLAKKKVLKKWHENLFLKIHFIPAILMKICMQITIKKYKKNATNSYFEKMIFNYFAN